MIKGMGWSFYLFFAGLGACCGIALAAIPRLMWHFVRKQAYRLLLKQWTDKSRVLTTTARRSMTSGRQSASQPSSLYNDLAVVDFLQGDIASAIAGFERASGESCPGATANLVAALTEAGAWDRLGTLLRPDGAPVDWLNETSLARISTCVPEDSAVHELWTLAQDRREPVLLNNLGIRAMRRGEFVEAQRAFATAIRQRPSYALAHANLGVLGHRQGDLSQALAETASAATLVGDDETICNNLGALLCLAHDCHQAHKWLTRAENLQPRSAEIVINLGNAQALQGLHDEATETYRRAISLGERLPEAYYNMAASLLTRQNYAGALENLELAESLQPEDPEILNNLGCVHFRQGRPEQACSLFRHAASLSSDGIYERNLVRAELAAGRFEQASAFCEQAGDDLVFERGLVHLLAATRITPETETHRRMLDFNLKAAAESFRKAAASGKSLVAEATFDLGLAQYMRGEYNAAAETFVSVIGSYRTQGEVEYVAGMCYLLAGGTEQERHGSADGSLAPAARELFAKGRPYLEKAAQAPGMAEMAGYNLGLVYYTLGEYQATIDVLRRVVRADSEPHLQNVVGLAQARLAQQMTLSAQTSALMGEARKREILAQAHTLLSSAVYYFRQALRRVPHDPMTHANVGLALMLRNEKDDVEAALQHWQLMHQFGDARVKVAFEAMMQMVSPEAASRLRFQDTDLAFLPLRVTDWISIPAPKSAGPKFFVLEMPDLPEWRLEASHRTVRKALHLRHKADRVRRKLRHLAI
jgi:Flp pilus assembly protein TadD